MRFRFKNDGLPLHFKQELKEAHAAVGRAFGFHVLPGTIPTFGLEYDTLRVTTGQFLSIDYKKGVIGDPKFAGEIIECSNGVIYLIDSILKPNTDDLFQRLQKDGRFTIFTKAITARDYRLQDSYFMQRPKEAKFGR